MAHPAGMILRKKRTADDNKEQMTIKIRKEEIPGTVIEAKRWWRREIRRQIRETSEDYRRDAARRITEAVTSMDEYRQAETIFAYYSYRREVNTAELIDRMLADGKRVCLPLCTDLGEDGKRVTDAPEMEAREIQGTAELIPGAYGIPEPGPETAVVKPEEVDMIILPCVTCDRECRRLGQGGGYYDKFLDSVRADCAKIAVCYETALADKLPVEEHDMPVDAVVTEERIYRWRPE
ncbi:MAG: 5-formyltetrahydrofolate cyclo-ligase [Mogibacterium sp.]|nr:5-formyltetrahydrofolate cyclo-ligase [Mogibacterium sp.]